jgi:hypothetical protein
MKCLFFCLLIAVTLLGCKKTKTDVDDSLPPITQEGKNTFGCLINGKVYLPKGFEQNQPNFQVDVDPSFNDGSFGVTFFNKTNERRIDFTIGSDSIRSTGYFLISENSRTNCYFAINGTSSSPDCIVLSNLNNTSVGFLKITRYDLNEQIFSGEFEFHFVNPDCGLGDTIHITQGRFDKKLN